MVDDLNKMVVENAKLAYHHNRKDIEVYYCFEGQYTDKKPFVFGTAILPLTASQNEILEEGKRKWHEVFPIDPPPLFYPVKGTLIFNKDE